MSLAAKLQPSISTFLQDAKQLEKHFESELARAALSMTLLRQKARVKFQRAEQMFFTTEALEQASSETVSRYRARRFQGFSKVGDFCTGIGGDAITLAEHAQVICVDYDPLRLAMAQQNVIVNECRNDASFIEADLMKDFTLPEVDAIFFDPARRVEGRRKLAVESYSPPLSVINDWRPKVRDIGVKLAPGIMHREIEKYDGEMEFISLEGELKECALWCGDLKTTARRATVLPEGATLVASGEMPHASIGPVSGVLYDPDPSVTRAGLVSVLAEQLEAHFISSETAYLCAQRKVATPFARSYLIEEVMPFHLKRLRQRLREKKVGQVDIKRRGSPIHPDDLRRQLKLQGTEKRILALARSGEEPVAIICFPG